jgi:hypothetical protein
MVITGHADHGQGRLSSGCYEPLLARTADRGRLRRAEWPAVPQTVYDILHVGDVL